MAEPVLSIEGLKLALPAMADRPYAVEDATLRIAAGETLCVVGESGSGKSMIAHAVMGLLPKAVKPVAAAHVLHRVFRQRQEVAASASA